MAEYCLSCYNRMNKKRLTESEVTLTKYQDLCEGCGKYKPVIIVPYRRNALWRLVCRLLRI